MMHQILKRLEIIKACIALEDEEVINLQVLKLSGMEIDDEIRHFLDQLSAHDYGSVILGIESYLIQYSGMVVYEDKELQGLRLELKVLESRLQRLSEQKNEYLVSINDFNTLYNLKLGDLIQKILNLKIEISSRKYFNQAPHLREKKDDVEKVKKHHDQLTLEVNELESELKSMNTSAKNYENLSNEYDAMIVELEVLDNELQDAIHKVEEIEASLKEEPYCQEYEEIKQEYEDFNTGFESLEKEIRYDLTEEESDELKVAFRKAVRLCHPDIVSDELKDQAHEMMQEINNAYTKNDLKRLKELLAALESGNGFAVASDTITDKALLKSKISTMREEIATADREIADLQNDEVFQTIQTLDDWDTYFESLRQELSEEYERLEQEFDQEAEFASDIS